jgi:putative membrane protein
MMWDYSYGMGFWGGFFMLFYWLFPFILVAGIARWLFLEWDRAHEPKSGHGVLDILKERYAKGEIGKEEFESKKRDLLN